VADPVLFAGIAVMLAIFSARYPREAEYALAPTAPPASAAASPGPQAEIKI
jgi:hypothetical protein